MTAAAIPVGCDVRLGEFELTGTELHIADPCYEERRHGVRLPDAVPGRWVGMCRYEDSWGIRPYYLMAFCVDAFGAEHQAPRIPTTLSEQSHTGWEWLINSVSVDSGQAGIFDAAHHRDDSVIDADPVFNSSLTAGPGEQWYAACCDATLSEARAGVVPHGVVSSSGMGDGGYSAYVLRDAEKRVIAVFIDFWGIENEDDDTNHEED